MSKYDSQIVVRLSKEAKKDVKAKAKKDIVKVSEYVRRLIYKDLEEREQK